jgi:leader peptidase (prepilin peptidase)/N-methyltransferase
VTGLPVWYQAVVAFVFGAAIASFLCVVAERLPRREPLGGRSRCACGRQLRASENIPILGWLRVGGRARCCNSRIPPSYLLSELAGGTITAVATVTYGSAGAVGAAVVGVAATAAVAAHRARTTR